MKINKPILSTERSPQPSSPFIPNKIRCISVANSSQNKPYSNHKQFYKQQSQKENINHNINHITQSSIKCFNHPSRIAKYTTNDSFDEIIYFCHNCAITVASKGFQVLKINSIMKQNNTNTQNNRQKLYLNQIKSVMEFTKQRYKFCLSTIQNAQLKLNRQISQINLYFSALYNQIDNKKNHLILTIQNQKIQINNIKKQIDNFFTKLISKVYEIRKVPSSLTQTQKNLNQLKKIKKVSSQIITQKINIKSYQFTDVCRVGLQITKLILDLSPSKIMNKNHNSSQFQNYLQIFNSSIQDACKSLSQSDNFTLDNFQVIQESNEGTSQNSPP